MQKNKLNFILSCLLLNIGKSYGNDQIQTIHSLEQVRDILQQVDQNGLVVWDVDDTLIVPDDKIIHDKFQHLDFIKEIPKVNLSKINLHSKKRLIEPCSAEIIKDLQQRKIKVIALTLRGHGPWHEIPCTEELLFAQLYLLGIDFRKSFEGYCSFESINCHQKPLFYKGIIFTNFNPKGDVLGHFLDNMNFRPAEVIFFDDVLRNVKSVAKKMSELGIPCRCYLYKGAEKLGITINEQLAKFQLHYLNQTNIWLSETEAERLIEAN